MYVVAPNICTVFSPVGWLADLLVNQQIYFTFNLISFSPLQHPAHYLYKLFPFKRQYAKMGNLRCHNEAIVFRISEY